MSRETVGSGAPDLNEYKDSLGYEVFPPQGVESAMRLPELVKVSLRKPDQIQAGLEDEVPKMITLLLLANNLSNTLFIGHREVAGARESIQEQVIGNLEIRGGKGLNPKYFQWLLGAVHAHAPTGLFHITREILTPKEEIDTSVQSRWALAGSKILQRLGGKHKTFDGKPEELDRLEEIAVSYHYLTLLESQTFASYLLSGCLAFGSKRQALIAKNILRRMRNIAGREDLSVSERLTQQTAVEHETLELARTVDYSQESLPAKASYFAESEIATFPLTAMKFTKSALLFAEAVEEARQSMDADQPAEDIPQSVDRAPQDSGLRTIDENAGSRNDYGDVADFRLKLSELAVETSRIAQPVTLGGKEIRRRGLDGMRSMLIRGCKDDDGVEIIPGRSAYDAQSLISNIEFVLSLIPSNGNLKTAQDRLEAAVKDSETADRDIGNFLGQAGERLSTADLMRLREQVPNIQPVGDIVEALRNEWPAISHIIEASWPAERKPTNYLQLHELLFSAGGSTSSSSEAA